MIKLQKNCAATLLTIAVAGCRTGGDDQPRLLPPSSATAVPAAANGGVAVRTPDADPHAPVTGAEARAELGEPAPDFELTDLEGRTHKLSAYRGKIVVLEWINPVCPAVVYAYGEGELREMKARHASTGIVWLAINSTAPGEEGSDLQLNRRFTASHQMRLPILLDPTGGVARSYSARTAPHLFVINERGLLVYSGALDNAPGGRVESLAAKTNYVERAIADLRSGHAVTKSTTRPYGCEVKHARP